MLDGPGLDISGICRLDDVSIRASLEMLFFKKQIMEKVMDKEPKQAKKEEHELGHGFKETQNPKESRNEHPGQSLYLCLHWREDKYAEQIPLAKYEWILS